MANKAKDVLRELEAMGTAQNRKIYARHGFEAPMFGVSYANLGKLKKRIKVDQGLAEELWESGNYDARVLATMIADPASMKVSVLDRWVRQAGRISGVISSVVAKHPKAVERVDKWVKSNDEWIGTAAYHAVADLAQNAELPDAWFAKHLETIEAKIHKAKNRTRYAMNNAVIAIGGYRAKLTKKAIAAAKRIGKVEVDHGETNCKTPDAVPYIQKMVARGKATNPSAKKTGTKKAGTKKAAPRKASAKR